MRLIFVPLWLSQVLDREKLTESALLDKERLLSYLSKADLGCYVNLPYRGAAYLEEVMGLDFPVNDPDFGFYLSKPFPIEDHEVDTRRLKDSSFAGDMIGRHLPEEYRMWLELRPISGANGDDAIGIFATLAERGKEGVDGYKRFLPELVKLLYAHNLTVSELARTGLLGAHIQTLGLSGPSPREPIV
jgi:hypothetical protein